jgi:hypothetical protein
MAKLNKRATATTSRLREHADATVNEEGGLAFKMDPMTELYTRVCTALVGEKQFYDETGKAKDEAILKLVAKVAKTNPEFILQLAAYARNEMRLRSIPQVLLVEATAYPETKQFVRKWTPSIIRRADELTEVMAYYQTRFGDIGNKKTKGMLCNPLKRGMADAFHQFDAYQLAKYDRDGPTKLRDVLKVCHPKWRDDEQKKMWGMLIKRELPLPKTWEVELTTKGASKEVWESILPRMNYMALLRNLRNLVQHKVDIKPVLHKLTDPKEVKNSKQLPFRFFSAYKALENNDDVRSSTKILDAMQTALELSIDNLPELNGVTFMSADNSGSMEHLLSEKGTVQLHEVANLFQAMAHKLCDEAITSVFGDNFAVVHASKSDGIITNMQRFRGTDVGCSTNAWKSLQWLNKKKEKVDRIIIFSDEQCYSTEGSGWGGYGDRGQSLAEQFEEYKRNSNPKCILYSIDLAGYGTSQFPMDDGSVVLLAGFSERLLDFIQRYETQKGNAISAIKTMKPRETTIPKRWFPQERKEGAEDEPEGITDTTG